MIQQIKKIFRLSNPARKIFWVAQIFDTTLPNFRNGRAITPPPLSPMPMGSFFCCEIGYVNRSKLLKNGVQMQCCSSVHWLGPFIL